jgi:hypothetical protein
VATNPAGDAPISHHADGGGKRREDTAQAGLLPPVAAHAELEGGARMPRVSIVVPVYNGAGFVVRCLDSLAAMRFADFEVIVVDDGSTDRAWSIVQSFARRDSRFARSLQIPHGGLGPARNRGLDHALGEFVAFVDADDYVDPDYCGAPLALACERNADLVCFGSWWVYPKRQVLHQPSYREGMTAREALLRMTPMVWEKLYRRDFLRSSCLRFPAICHEDEVFMPSLMAHAPRVALLSRPLYYYVQREGSISGPGGPTADVLQAFQLVLDLSRTMPDFRHELEFYAVRVLTWSASCWGRSKEDWAKACQGKAKLLLDAIDHPGSDNPYLIRARQARERRRFWGGDWLLRFRGWIGG